MVIKITMIHDRSMHIEPTRTNIVHNTLESQWRRTEMYVWRECSGMYIVTQCQRTVWFRYFIMACTFTDICRLVLHALFGVVISELTPHPSCWCFCLFMQHICSIKINYMFSSLYILSSDIIQIGRTHRMAIFNATVSQLVTRTNSLWVQECVCPVSFIVDLLMLLVLFLWMQKILKI